jgi:Leucine-rich repeat (LRR) protein
LLSFFDEFQEIRRDQVDLPNLTYLSLNGNNLTRVPSVLKYFPKLQQVHLHMNKITDLKELCRKSYANLEVVDLGNNKIREVPIALAHYLSSLNFLNLVNNDLSQVPPLFGLHKTLKTLQLDGNPLKTLRRPILDKGTDAILKHLRDKYIEGRDDFVEDWALEMEKEDV